ncbi:hypothetical protein ABLE93_17725 [Xanthobacter sp. KR7-65]|uniref:hypothetical protein n=1 Tax=Xanthobacter sp. KR7-65 TaxID=3156612 RepID=UPI0032B3DFC9
MLRPYIAKTERATDVEGKLFDRIDQPAALNASGPFQMEASVVPQRFFVPGRRGYESMQALRNAAPGAIAQIREYAISTLCKAAQSPLDGTLDPAKVQAWRQKQADALHAMPELDRMLADPLSEEEMATLQAIAADLKRSKPLNRGGEDPRRVEHRAGHGSIGEEHERAVVARPYALLGALASAEAASGSALGGKAGRCRRRRWRRALRPYHRDHATGWASEPWTTS